MNYMNVDILLVEDNLQEAKLTIMSLEENRLSSRLFHVEDGAEALDFLFALGKYEARLNYRNPKLILLDLKLPKINGFEVLKEVKNHERTKYIPVVILTSSGENRDVEAGYQLGVNSYIVKPVAFDSFSKAVADLGMYWTVLNTPPLR